MWRKRVLLAVLAIGCGPARQERPVQPGDEETGGAGGATGGVSGAGAGAGSSAGGLAAAGGSISAPPIPPPPSEPGTHPAIECGGATPHPLLGGYVKCEDGTVRRPTAAECVSHLPFVPPDDTRVGNECTVDADCGGVHDYCEWGICQRGCVRDAECGPSQVCLCEEPVGRCVAAACKSDADCPAEYPCTGSFGGAWSGFMCQHPEDECQTDEDCGSGRSQCVTPSPRTCVIMPG